MSKRLYALFAVLLTAYMTAAIGCGCGDDDDDDDDTDDDSGSDDDSGTDDDSDDDGADDDTSDDDDDAGNWWPPPTGWSAIYEVFEYLGNTYDMTATVLGEEDVNGDPWTVVELGDFGASDIVGMKGWLDFSTPYQVGFTRGHVYWTNISKADDTEPDGVFEMTDPAYIIGSSNLNDPQVDVGEGTWTINDVVSEYTMELTTTTLDLNATVTVPYGTVNGCVKLQVDSFETFSEWPDSNITVYFYAHPDLGFVKMEGDLFGFAGFRPELKEIL